MENQVYLDYINSEEWAEKSRRFIWEASSCENCGSKENLQCHHLNYDNLGNETREDVEVLCKKCHDDKHPKGKGAFLKKKVQRINDRVGGQKLSKIESEVIEEFKEQNPIDDEE